MKKERINHDKSWAYFVSIGKIPVDAKKCEWCLHHVDQKLKYEDIDRYNEWRIEDLVPMTTTEHMKLHAKNRHHTEESKKKISQTLKGHEVSEETRKKIGDACRGRQNPKTSAGLKEYFKTHDSWIKGKHHTEESKKKMSERLKGENHPLFGKHRSEETKRKISEAQRGKPNGQKGLRWFNDGTKNIKALECPEGFVPGRIGGWHWNQSK